MTDEQTERLQMRVSPEFIKTVDAWRRRQEDLPSRSEAIRRLVEMARTSTKKLQIDASDLKAALSLMDAYAKKEGRGAHFKDNEQMLPDSYYAVRVGRLRDALDANQPKAKGK